VPGGPTFDRPEGGHDAFDGLRQLARTPADWRDDAKVTYRRTTA